MADLPTVAVMLFTYDRLQTAKVTLEALHQHLYYEGPLHLHVADDGSPREGYIDELLNPVDRPVPNWESRSSTNSQRGGYGASYNAATQAVHDFAEILLPLEDDWELTRYFDITPFVRDLTESQPVNCFRFGYLGQTQPLRGVVTNFAHTGKGLVLDPESEERHVFAGHPRLEHREYERAIGPWPEGLQAGQTEFEVAGRSPSRNGVVWPLDIGNPGSQQGNSLFRHIGFDEKGEIDPNA